MVLLLNAADDGIGNGRLVGPTDTGIAVGDGGVLTCLLYTSRCV